MQINWKVRFQNKTWVTAFAAAALAFVYDILGMCGVVPAVSEDTVSQVILLLVKVLVMLGVVVDPTSSGVTDSANAMSYETPNCVKCTRSTPHTKDTAPSAEQIKTVSGDDPPPDT